MKLRQENAGSGVIGWGQGAGGRGAECPLTFFNGKFLMTYREKLDGKEEEEKENLKVERWKLENEQRTFLFETTEICLGSTKMDNEKSYYTPGKIGKTDFTPPPLKIFLFRH